MCSSDVAVLGAGVTGCCLALELARRGYKVDLYDCAPTPMTGASLHNEGKLHLGFVYANDPLKKTHKLLVQGSLAFSRIFEDLTGYGPASCLLSRPFHYYVPSDSQLGMDSILDHFHMVEAAANEVTERTGERYLGLLFDRYFELNSTRQHKNLFSSGPTLGSIRTEERSVSTTAVAEILRQSINNAPNITFLGDTKVVSASRLPDGVEIESSRDGKPFRQRYPSAANCLWDDKLRVDRTAGIYDDGPWLFRYKVTIRTNRPKQPNNIPSATGILGAYGDVVNHNDGSYYISWYPTCKISESKDEDGRKLHDTVHKGFLRRGLRSLTAGFPSIARHVSSIAHRLFIRESIMEMATYIPSIKQLLNTKGEDVLGGGVILARGKSDIYDHDSGLHQRAEIGPVAYDAYVTVNTGKYCMGPMFAIQTADMLSEILQ